MKMRDSVPSEVAVDVVTLAEATRNRCENKVPREGKIPLALALAAILATILALAACNSNTPTTPPAKPESKAPELLTGRAAFYKVFIAARNYAADAKPFRIESTSSSESIVQDGKSTLSHSSSASPNQISPKPFV